MAFEMWRDYLQLISVIKDMAKAELSKPHSCREVLMSPAERPKDTDINDCNSFIQSNHFIAHPQVTPTMLSPHSDMEPESHPTYSPMQDSFFFTSAQDQASTTQASRLHVNLLGAHQCSQPNANETKTFARPSLSPQHGENAHNGICSFCKHNGETPQIYMGHSLKDELGRILCPVLRMYTCSLCGATGDASHTKKYCPLNKDKNSFYKKGSRNSSGRKIKR